MVIYLKPNAPYGADSQPNAPCGGCIATQHTLVVLQWWCVWRVGDEDDGDDESAGGVEVATREERLWWWRRVTVGMVMMCGEIVVGCGVGWCGGCWWCRRLLAGKIAEADGEAPENERKGEDVSRSKSLSVMFDDLHQTRLMNNKVQQMGGARGRAYVIDGGIDEDDGDDDSAGGVDVATREERLWWWRRMTVRMVMMCGGSVVGYGVGWYGGCWWCRRLLVEKMAEAVGEAPKNERKGEVCVCEARVMRKP
nr:hypothetical protein [Tanacetum cinerariifolium]